MLEPAMVRPTKKTSRYEAKFSRLGMMYVVQATEVGCLSGNVGNGHAQIGHGGQL